MGFGLGDITNAIIGSDAGKSTKSSSITLGNSTKSGDLAEDQFTRFFNWQTSNWGDTVANTNKAQGMLNEAMTSFNPSNEDRASAARLMAPRRLALQQQFEDSQKQVNQRSLQLGRSITDPVLQAKLRQEQTRMSAGLDAEESASAIDLFSRRLSLASQQISQMYSSLNPALQALQQSNNLRLGSATTTDTESASFIGMLGGLGSGAGSTMQGYGAMKGSSSAAGSTGSTGGETAAAAAGA